MTTAFGLFGGVKESGLGWKECLEVKTLYLGG